MPDKLTDSEIVKALRSWLEEIRKARQEYLEKVNEEHYPSMRYEYLLSDTINEINRQKAEKEELVGNIDRLKAELFDKTEQLETAKAEAYKEFAERLKAVYEGFDDKNEVILYSNLLTAIDCLLIGMVGDK